MVNTLTFRVNYFICEKFMEKVLRVVTDIKYRNLNSAYDAIIDEANRGYIE